MPEDWNAAVRLLPAGHTADIPQSTPAVQSNFPTGGCIESTLRHHNKSWMLHDCHHLAHSAPLLMAYVQVQRSKLFELKSAAATRLLIHHICSFSMRATPVSMPATTTQQPIKQAPHMPKPPSASVLDQGIISLQALATKHQAPRSITHDHSCLHSSHRHSMQDRGAATP